MTQIFLSEIDTLMNEEAILSYFPFLSHIRQEKILRLRSESDRTQSIMTELLLRKVAGDFFKSEGKKLPCVKPPPANPISRFSPNIIFSSRTQKGPSSLRYLINQSVQTLNIPDSLKRPFLIEFLHEASEKRRCFFIAQARRHLF